MLKKISIVCIILMFIFTAVFIVPYDKSRKVIKVNSPCEIDFKDEKFIFKEFECFDNYFSDRNKILAKSLGINEEEAFILGNLGTYWAKNLLEGRNVSIYHNDFLYYKHSYSEKFKYSGFCIDKQKPCFEDAFNFQLNKLRKAKYKVLDLDTDNIYEISDEKVKTLKNYLVLRKSHLPHKKKKTLSATVPITSNKPLTAYYGKNYKVILSDSTTKLKPDRKCSTEMCQEILKQIDNTKESIDIAIYGYSDIPEIKTALENALKRGVKIRLVYDSDIKGENIYHDTKSLTELLKENSSDKNSTEAMNIMHNKFYIFDNKILITGSTNLAHTDMSGFNSNAMIVLNSKNIAELYKTEFEQMYNGKFHNSKTKTRNNFVTETIKVYFSPQDKTIKNAIIPLIKNAHTYIYIPTFVLTEYNLTEELINAYNRNVDVKIIADALSASTKHTKIYELRKAGIPVKIENYAGKMHSKSIIIDDKEIVIGSMNFSNSGENRNDENVILIKDTNLAKFYKDFFIYQWNRIDDKWLTHTPKAEGKDSIGSCSDGLDNDYDGLIDMEDNGCK